MTRHLTILASLLVVAACASRTRELDSSPPSQPISIFRTIDVAPFGRITLSEPFTQRTTLGVSVNDRTYLLAGGRFADTDSILVTVDTLGRVESIDFVYTFGKDFA